MSLPPQLAQQAARQEDARERHRPAEKKGQDHSHELSAEGQAFKKYVPFVPPDHPTPEALPPQFMALYRTKNLVGVNLIHESLSAGVMKVPRSAKNSKNGMGRILFLPNPPVIMLFDPSPSDPQPIGTLGQGIFTAFGQSSSESEAAGASKLSNAELMKFTEVEGKIRVNAKKLKTRLHLNPQLDGLKTKVRALDDYLRYKIHANNIVVMREGRYPTPSSIPFSDNVYMERERDPITQEVTSEGPASLSFVIFHDADDQPRTIKGQPGPVYGWLKPSKRSPRFTVHDRSGKPVPVEKIMLFDAREALPYRVDVYTATFVIDRVWITKENICYPRWVLQSLVVDLTEGTSQETLGEAYSLLTGGGCMYDSKLPPAITDEGTGGDANGHATAMVDDEDDEDFDAHVDMASVRPMSGPSTAPNSSEDAVAAAQNDMEVGVTTQLTRSKDDDGSQAHATTQSQDMGGGLEPQALPGTDLPSHEVTGKRTRNEAVLDERADAAGEDSTKPSAKRHKARHTEAAEPTTPSAEQQTEAHDEAEDGPKGMDETVAPSADASDKPVRKDKGEKRRREEKDKNKDDKDKDKPRREKEKDKDRSGHKHDRKHDRKHGKREHKSSHSHKRRRVAVEASEPESE